MSAMRIPSRFLPTEVKYIERAEYRCTPLFDRFMRFEFTERPRHDPFLMRQWGIESLRFAERMQMESLPPWTIVALDGSPQR